MDATIYMITNSINAKIYVGQTWKTAEERFARHCAESRWLNTKNMPIVFAIKKYGQDKFQVQVLEIIKDATQNDADTREIYWVNEKNSFSPNGYNLRAGQSSGVLSEESRRKISKANTGRKISEETRRRLRESHLGHKQSPETKKKLSDIHRGRIFSDDHRKKIGAANKGRKFSDSTKKKMSLRKLKYNYRIVSPTGEVYFTDNLTIFCKQHNLRNGCMRLVVNGKRPHHRQWTGIKMVKA